MDIATIAGAVSGTILILICMLMSGSLSMYWDFLSLLIVVGGALASSMMRWPLKNFLGGVKVGLGAVSSKLESQEELVEEVCDLAKKARMESVLALEKVSVENVFLAKGLKLAIDGADPNLINTIMSQEISQLKKRLSDSRGIYEDMGEACPAFGMIGTVIGLIVIMANLADPSKIGPGLAVALITTLYGSLIANMFFIPVSKKLKYRGSEEIKNFEIIRIGILAISEGTNPTLLREQLDSFLS